MARDIRVSYALENLLIAGLLAIVLAGCGRKPEAAAPAPVAPIPTELPEPSPEQHTPESTAKPNPPKVETAPSSGPVTVVDLHGNEWRGEPKELPQSGSLPVRLAPESRPAETDSAAYSLRTDAGHLLSMSFETPLTTQEVQDFYTRELNGAVRDEQTGTITGTAKGYEIVILVSEGAQTLYEIQVWA